MQGLLSCGRHGNCYLPYQTQPYSSTLIQTVIGSSVTGITRIKRAMMGGRRSFRTTSYVSMLPWITWRREVLISNFSLLCDSCVQGCNCTPSLQTGEISHTVPAEGRLLLLPSPTQAVLWGEEKGRWEMNAHVDHMLQRPSELLVHSLSFPHR